MVKQHTGTSISSSVKSFKSLASKASMTIKNIKHKAVEILSPKKKKKAKCVPEANGDSLSSTDNSSTPPLEKSLHHNTGSIIDIPDEDDPDDVKIGSLQCMPSMKPSLRSVTLTTVVATNSSVLHTGTSIT
jgi:hypothetical protein